MKSHLEKFKSNEERVSLRILARLVIDYRGTSEQGDIEWAFMKELKELAKVKRNPDFFKLIVNNLPFESSFRAVVESFCFHNSLFEKDYFKGVYSISSYLEKVLEESAGISIEEGDKIGVTYNFACVLIDEEGREKEIEGLKIRNFNDTLFISLTDEFTELEYYLGELREIGFMESKGFDKKLKAGILNFTSPCEIKVLYQELIKIIEAELEEGDELDDFNSSIIESLESQGKVPNWINAVLGGVLLRIFEEREFTFKKNAEIKKLWARIFPGLKEVIW